MKNHKAALSLAIIVSVIVMIFLGIRGCSNQKKPSEECSGGVRPAACPAGEVGRVIEACIDGKWAVSSKECRASACNQTTFTANLEPLIKGKCVSCHAGFDKYETAKAKIDGYIDRTSRGDDSSGRMPLAPNPPLAQEEKDIFTQWKSDGFVLACEGEDGPNSNPLLALDDIESAILSDLNTLTAQQQLDVRYVITTNKSNEKATNGVLAQFKAGVNKSVNNLSFVRGIVLASPIDRFSTVFRFSLRDIKISAADWRLIEGADPINFESFTNVGVLLKQITRARKPWMHAEAFAFASNQAPVYHAIRKLPATIKELFLQAGVNAAGDLASFEALHVGLQTSRVSINKNRLLTRFVGNDGGFWFTSDVLQGSQANVFKTPLLISASGNANFVSDGAESIGFLPNGLHFYFLSDAAGKRVDAGPLNLVSDYLSPFSPEIRNSLSCFRCHNAGMIPASDQIKAGVLANRAQFDPRDIDQIEQLYRDPAPFFTEDNDQYAVALSKMGILVTDADPINLVADNMRAGKNAAQLAALLGISEAELIDEIDGSALLSSTIGQLTTPGGSISFEQLVISMPDILKETAINQNPQ